MRLAGLFIVLLALSSFPAFAQTKACTEMGCQNGLVFHVDPAQEWKHGKYEIILALGFKQVICRGELPLKPCEEGPSFICDDKHVTIGESGCALPSEQQGLSDIRIDQDPHKVMINIKRNYRTILTRTTIPRYEMMMPNGPGCGPVCRGATYDLFGTDDLKAE